VDACDAAHACEQMRLIFILGLSFVSSSFDHGANVVRATDFEDNDLPAPHADAVINGSTVCPQDNMLSFRLQNAVWRLLATEHRYRPFRHRQYQGHGVFTKGYERTTETISGNFNSEGNAISENAEGNSNSQEEEEEVLLHTALIAPQYFVPIHYALPRNVSPARVQVEAFVKCWPAEASFTLMALQSEDRNWFVRRFEIATYNANSDAGNGSPRPAGVRIQAPPVGRTVSRNLNLFFMRMDSSIVREFIFGNDHGVESDAAASSTTLTNAKMALSESSETSATSLYAHTLSWVIQTLIHTSWPVFGMVVYNTRLHPYLILWEWIFREILGLRMDLSLTKGHSNKSSSSPETTDHRMEKLFGIGNANAAATNSKKPTEMSQQQSNRRRPSSIARLAMITGAPTTKEQQLYRVSYRKKLRKELTETFRSIAVEITRERKTVIISGKAYHLPQSRKSLEKLNPNRLSARERLKYVLRMNFVRKLEHKIETDRRLRLLAEEVEKEDLAAQEVEREIAEERKKQAQTQHDDEKSAEEEVSNAESRATGSQAELRAKNQAENIMTAVCDRNTNWEEMAPDYDVSIERIKQIFCGTAKADLVKNFLGKLVFRYWDVDVVPGNAGDAQMTTAERITVTVTEMMDDIFADSQEPGGTKTTTSEVLNLSHYEDVIEQLVQEIVKEDEERVKAQEARLLKNKKVTMDQRLSQGQSAKENDAQIHSEEKGGSRGSREDKKSKVTFPTCNLQSIFEYIDYLYSNPRNRALDENLQLPKELKSLLESTLTCLVENHIEGAIVENFKQVFLKFYSSREELQGSESESDRGGDRITDENFGSLNPEAVEDEVSLDDLLNLHSLPKAERDLMTVAKVFRFFTLMPDDVKGGTNSVSGKISEAHGRRMDSGAQDSDEFHTGDVIFDGIAIGWSQSSFLWLIFFWALHQIQAAFRHFGTCSAWNAPVPESDVNDQNFETGKIRATHHEAHTPAGKHARNASSSIMPDSDFEPLSYALLTRNSDFEPLSYALLTRNYPDPVLQCFARRSEKFEQDNGGLRSRGYLQGVSHFPKILQKHFEGEGEKIAKIQIEEESAVGIKNANYNQLMGIQNTEDLENLSGCSLILDIGANVGGYTFEFPKIRNPNLKNHLNQFLKVIAIEPHPENVANLRATMRANKEIRSRVFVVAKAVSSNLVEENLSEENNPSDNRTGSDTRKNTLYLYERPEETGQSSLYSPEQAANSREVDYLQSELDTAKISPENVRVRHEVEISSVDKIVEEMQEVLRIRARIGEVQGLEGEDIMKSQKVGSDESNKVCLIKIDAEGQALNILKGGIETLKKDRPVLVVELDSANGRTVWPPLVPVSVDTTESESRSESESPNESENLKNRKLRPGSIGGSVVDLLESIRYSSYDSFEDYVDATQPEYMEFQSWGMLLLQRLKIGIFTAIYYRGVGWDTETSIYDTASRNSNANSNAERRTSFSTVLREYYSNGNESLADYVVKSGEEKTGDLGGKEKTDENLYHYLANHSDPAVPASELAEILWNYFGMGSADLENDRFYVGCAQACITSIKQGCRGFDTAVISETVSTEERENQEPRRRCRLLSRCAGFVWYDEESEDSNNFKKGGDQSVFDNKNLPRIPEMGVLSPWDPAHRHVHTKFRAMELDNDLVAWP